MQPPYGPNSNKYTIYFSKKQRKADETYTRAVKLEESSLTNELASWKKFAQQAFEHRKRTLEIIGSFQGQNIIGFGASARSSTYLNYCGLTSAQIRGIIDNNPLKQGFYTAGSNIPIISKEKGMASNPDLMFILAWNLKDEIIDECHAAGFKGQFLVPFPENPYLIPSFKQEGVL